MTLIKWITLFVCAFCVAFVIIVTFSQDPFKQHVPAMIFTYQTAAIPIYLYVVGALCLGLIVGFAVALYQFITLKSTMYKKSKTIKELEEKIAILEHASLKVPPDEDSGPVGLPHSSE
ncbi:MAG: LapA family protein [Chitinivibrionales bacterium]